MVATATRWPSLNIHAEAVRELLLAGANPLDIVAEHLRQGRETSVHVLPNGEKIGVWSEDGLVTMLALPRSFPAQRR